MFEISILGRINEVKSFWHKVRSKYAYAYRQRKDNRSQIKLSNSRGKSYFKTKLCSQTTSVYLLDADTRYIDIFPSKRYVWFEVTVISLLPHDGLNRYSHYRISATKSQSSRIDLTGFKTSGLLPTAIEVTQGSQ